jgi:hypothetical protein
MVGRGFLLVSVVAWLGAGAPLRAESIFEIDGGTAPVGTRVDSRVLVTNDAPLPGFQIYVFFDGAILDLKEITISGTDAEAFMPEFFEGNIFDTFGEAGLIFDFQAPFEGRALPPGERQSVLRLRFQSRPDPALDGECSALDLRAPRPPLSPDDVVIDGQVCFDGAPRFRRGDCNGDGAVVGQVSDAVFLFAFLFARGREPPCLDACDANDDGVVVGLLTDGIYLLNFSFLTGARPPAPFPACGLDPTPDGLPCGFPPGCP